MPKRFYLLFVVILILLLTLSSCGYSKTDIEKAEQWGFKQGYDSGFEDGYSKGYDSGSFSGYDEGYDVGYEEGYYNGLLDDDTEATEPEGGWPKIKKDK